MPYRIFNHFDALAFFTGTGAGTAAGGGLINSAVLVAVLVLLTKLVEWRIKSNERRKQTLQEQEMIEAKVTLATELHENNRLLRKIAGEEEPATDAPNVRERTEPIG